MGSVARACRRWPALAMSLLVLFLCAAGWAQTTTLAIPALVSPANNATGVAVPTRLTWNAPGAYSYTYGLQVSRNDAFTDLVYTSDTLIEPAATVAGLAAGTRYWWRARAYNDAGYSAWSSAFSFTTVTDAALKPATPTLLAPASGATGVPVNASLTWNAAARATTYTVQLARNQGFTDGVQYRAGVTATSAGFGDLLTNTPYFWRVKAVNATSESDWSATWYFVTTTTVATVPAQPVLCAPARGAAAALPIKLQWLAAARAAGYTVQVSATDAFTTLLVGKEFITPTALDVTSLPSNARYFWRVRAINSAGASLWSETWSFTLGTPVNNKLAPPVLVSPVNGKTGAALSPAFTWKPSDGALKYDLQVRNGATVVATREGLVGTSESVTGLAANTTYQWAVRAVNADGASVWSAAWTFTTTPNTAQVPATPELLSPADGAIGVTPDAPLYWKAAERATTYSVLLALIDPVYQKELRIDGVTATSAKLPNLPYGTKWTWRVRGVNAAGAGAWSAPRTFTVVAPPPPAPPAAPVLLMPADAAVDLAQTVTLKWAAAERAVSYTVQVAMVSTFSPLVFSKEQVTGTSIDVTSLQVGACYLWRVKAVNGTGASAWSTVWSFSTKGAANTLLPPLPPTLRYPENTAVNVPLQARLLWTPGERATGSIVQYSIDETFATSLVVNAGQSIAGVDLTLNPGKTYFWRVKSKNAVGESAWSPTWRFATVPPEPVVVIPPAPALIAPGQNAVDQPTASVRLYWATSSGAAYYTVQLSSTETFSDNVYTRPGVTACVIDTPSLMPSTKYFWRVRAINSAGESAWSSIRAFTTSAPTAAMLPGAVTLQAPLANATGQATPLLLQWSPAERATTYVVQVAKTSDFTDILFTKENLFSNTFNIAELATSTTYFWRVRGSNQYGTGPWSAPRAFTTAAPPAPVLPGVPVLLAPAAGARDLAVTVKFTWQAAERATSYAVQVSLNDAFTDLISPAYSVLGTSLETTVKANVQHYWRVRGVNANGNGAWSEPRTFATAGTSTPVAPTAPMLYYPFSGFTGIQQSTSLYWYATTGATRYILQVSKVTDFAIVAYKVDNLTLTSTTIYDLQPNTTYFWRVKAANAVGESAWSQTWNFITATEFANLPPAPAIVAPDNGKLTGLRPRLTWAPVNGVRGYIVEVATDALFTQKLASETLSAITTAFQVAPGLSYNTTYFWRVRSLNLSGLSPWSPTRSFTPSQQVM